MRYLILLTLCFALPCCGSNTEPHKTNRQIEVEANQDAQLMKDLYELMEGGVGDVLQMALINKHQRPIAMTTQQIIALKKKGFSERVIKQLITGYKK
jgi:hypothetical protein